MLTIRKYNINIYILSKNINAPLYLVFLTLHQLFLRNTAY